MTELMIREEEDIAAESTTSMVLIPAGEFLMGSEVGSDFERPVHAVYVDAFRIDATPVTNAQFARFVEATGYRTTAESAGVDSGAPDERRGAAPSWRTYATPERAEHPVVYVSWFDADAYARWCGKRLPTEAEWEKAARGNLEGKLFPWGDAAADASRINWNRLHTDVALPPPTTPVRSFPPNGYGVHDTAGNVWEWCRDWYRDDYYSVSPRENPQGPEVGRFKVRRGASWNVREAFRLRCANRGAMLPENFWPNIGFRCVLEAG